MSSGMKVTVLENHIEDIKKSLREKTLENAAMAGGQVIRNNAILNIQRTFKNVHGTRGLSRIVVQVQKKSNTSCTVDIGPTVVYGRIHELGGIIRPIKAKMLSWVNEAGQRVFANAVHIPARPYMRPAVDDHMDEIKQAVGAAVAEGVRQSL